MIQLGSHVSMSGKEMLLGSAKEAYSYGANTFMFYTGAPQNTRRKEISELNIEPAWDYMKEHDIDNIVVHAPYIINLGNTIKPETFKLAVDFLQLEVQRSEACKSRTLILHPGAHVGAGTDAGIRQIIKGLNEVITKDMNLSIALETMAGKGSEIGSRFEELREILDRVTLSDKLGVCLDTCHVYDAGYDIVGDLDGVLETFDAVIGLEKLKAIHINDSKNPCGAHKDRHENLGEGYIGFDALSYIVHHPDFSDVPKILETPWIPIDGDKKNTRAPYKEEIALLRGDS